MLGIAPKKEVKITNERMNTQLTLRKMKISNSQLKRRLMEIYKDKSQILDINPEEIPIDINFKNSFYNSLDKESFLVNYLISHFPIENNLLNYIILNLRIFVYSLLEPIQNNSSKRLESCFSENSITKIINLMYEYRFNSNIIYIFSQIFSAATCISQAICLYCSKKDNIKKLDEILSVQNKNIQSIFLNIFCNCLMENDYMIILKETSIEKFLVSSLIIKDGNEVKDISFDFIEVVVSSFNALIRNNTINLIMNDILSCIPSLFKYIKIKYSLTLTGCSFQIIGKYFRNLQKDSFYYDQSFNFIDLNFFYPFLNYTYENKEENERILIEIYSILSSLCYLNNKIIYEIIDEDDKNLIEKTGELLDNYNNLQYKKDDVLYEMSLFLNNISIDQESRPIIIKKTNIIQNFTEILNKENLNKMLVEMILSFFYEMTKDSDKMIYMDLLCNDFHKKVLLKFLQDSNTTNEELNYILSIILEFCQNLSNIQSKGNFLKNSFDELNITQLVQNIITQKKNENISLNAEKIIELLNYKI